MKNLFLMIVLISSFAFTQTNNLDRFPSKLYQKDTLTTSIDTMDVSFNSDLGIESYVVTAYCPSGADTLQVYSMMDDNVTWSPRALLSFTSGSAVATLPVSTTVLSGQIYKTGHSKIRIISTSNDGSTTVVIVSGSKSDPIR